MPRQFNSFVAVGDSFTEGMVDPRGDGTFRGWADRVAEVLAAQNPDFRYANLAVRGRLFKDIVNQQVPAAISMRPELISFVAGGNDALRPGFDLPKISRRLDWVVGRLSDTGATVLLLTAADVTFLLPARRVIEERAEAYNDVIRQTAARHGAVLADLWRDRGFVDRRMWGSDRLHLSPAGHRRAAGRVLAALGIPVDDALVADLPPATARPWLRARSEDLRWAGRYFAPWVRRRLTGRSSGDGITAKRPTLDRMTAASTEDLDGGATTQR
ncbi:SGNH hydrolase [Actinocatenispora thailandica]|uniref:SGNH hydrolase n=1 Tax=Actinocatenispora thailandica TaxID=227318 RepID=A0A7R7HZY8_9ACTN|nr:SGNH hydrolase [Actinocatenispora thailandica]